MVRTLNANQTKKIDRPFIQPIYLIHMTGTWTYSGNETGDHSLAYEPSSTFIGALVPLEGITADYWLTDRGGVRVGDKFRFNTDPVTTFGTVKYVLGDKLVQLTTAYPGPSTYGHYTFSRTQTFYFSDRNLKYNSIDYEDYLFDFSNLEEEIQNLGGYNNATITLRFRNERIQHRNYLIELLDDYPIEGQYIEIYKLCHDTGEVYVTDVSTKIFKGIMGQPYDITDFDFKVDCHSMLFGKNYKLPLHVITGADYPDADPDDIGKYRNIIYGSCKKIICPWTVAGWASTLAEGLTNNGMSIVVSEVPTGSFNYKVVIDDEIITIASFNVNTKTLAVLSRGADGTQAVAHNKVATIYEKRTYYEAEVAQHPVKSISDIFVKRTSNDEWLRVTEGATKYIDDGGRAYIRFSDKVKYGSQVNVTADTTTDEGSHSHTYTFDYSQKECIPDGSAGSYGHSLAIDGNTGTFCSMGYGGGVQARFDTLGSLGTIVKQLIWIYKNDTASTGYVQCPYGTNLNTLGSGSGWSRIVKIGGNWSDSVVVMAGAVGNQIGEIYKIIEYIPFDNITEPGPAVGVDVDVQLSGNSAANMVIGDIVAADVEGYADDVLGTYTGTPYGLIEMPEYVRYHILIALLGFDSTTDIDDSFAYVGSDHYLIEIAGGYKLAFVMHEVATEAMDLFREIDLQTRSNMFESGGQFCLAFGSTDIPVSVMTFDRDNIQGLFNFGKTEIADIKNYIRGYYNRDYLKTGDLGTKYKGVTEISAIDSLTQYGEYVENIEFSCVGDLPAMVADVIAWIVREKQNILKTVSFDAFWDATILESCDYFHVTSKFWSDKLFKTIKLVQNPSNNIITIYGLEYITPQFLSVWTVHDQIVTSPDILQINFSNALSCTNSQSATSAMIFGHIISPENVSHAQVTTSLSDLTYFSTLTVQSGTIVQSVSIITVDPWMPGNIPEVIPNHTIHVPQSGSPIMS